MGVGESTQVEVRITETFEARTRLKEGSSTAEPSQFLVLNPQLLIINICGVQAIDKDLLKILTCPVCKESVEEKDHHIICLKCGRKYPIRDGILVMLVEEPGS